MALRRYDLIGESRGLSKVGINLIQEESPDMWQGSIKCLFARNIG